MPDKVTLFSTLPFQIPSQTVAESKILIVYSDSNCQRKETGNLNLLQVPVNAKQAEMFGRQAVFVSGIVIRCESHHLKSR